MSYLTNEQESAIEQAAKTAINENTIEQEVKDRGQSVLRTRVTEPNQFKNKAVITIGSENEYAFEKMVSKAKDTLEGLVDATSKTVNLYEYKTSGDTDFDHDLELHFVVEPESAMGPHHDW